MEGYKYLVLGSGVGKAVAHWLIRQNDTAVVSLADADYYRAVQAGTAAGIRRRSHIGRIFEFHAECDNAQDIFQPFDVIVSALPARYNPKLAQAAISAGAHFCDLGGVVDITRKMLELDDKAKSAGLAVVPDCGLMPGLGNILVQHSISLLGHMGSVSPLTAAIRVGGLPQVPQGPLNYQRIFSLEGLKHLCYDRVPVVHSGKVVECPPFAFFHTQRIPELAMLCPRFDQVELFASAGAALAPWHFQKQNVRAFYELTIRWPGFVPFVRDLKPSEFEEKIGPHLAATDAEHPDLVYMDVIVKELEGEKRNLTHQLLEFYDFATDLTAMERTTGFATAVMARMLARGHAAPGVRTAEQALDAKATAMYLDALSGELDITRTI